MPILNLSPAMTKWFSGMIGATIRCKEVFSLWLWILTGSGGYAIGLIMKAIERVVFAEFTCILALGGSIVGIIGGAIQGQTTEAGFLDGAGKGAVTGAIAALELLNFAAAASDEPISKVVLLRSLLNGEVFMEWICPAVAQAYKCHINAQETTHREASNIYYDVRGVTLKGMPQNFTQKLPVQQFDSSIMLKLYNVSCCSICFQDFEEGEFVKILPKCCHFFHIDCIDKWLVQQRSCPTCRAYVPHL